MAHRLTHRFTSFLDRFESRLEVDCERLKQQLIARVDHQFGVVRSKVSELRGRFSAGGYHPGSVPSLHLDDPKVETVSLDEWIMERRTAELRDAPSTSSGYKRKSTNRSQTSNKRLKTQSTSTATNKHPCKYPGCDKTLVSDAHLAMHERIHLGIKPFSCSLSNCGYSSEKRGNVIQHVREKHFKLPRKKKGEPLITDDRDPNQYVQVDNDLLQRRLE